MGCGCGDHESQQEKRIGDCAGISPNPNLAGRPMISSAEQTDHARGEVVTRLNWLRAGVLGANDGIISTAGLVIGVAAASAEAATIATAGVAGLVAGAVSMGLGEYISVSAQRDTESALIETMRSQLHANPDEGRDWLVSMLRKRGVSVLTSSRVAAEFSDQEVLRAHLIHGLGIAEDEVANPWVAAASSVLSFSLGAALPVLAILLPPPEWRIPVAFVAVMLGLAVTGWLSALLGQSSRRSAVVRLLVGGALAMAVTYGVGQLGTAVV